MNFYAIRLYFRDETFSRKYCKNILFNLEFSMSITWKNLMWVGYACDKFYHDFYLLNSR